MLPFVSYTKAQSRLSVEGKVTNNSEEPLAYVNVYALNTFDGAMTDADGNFSFTTELKDTVQIISSLVGYRTEKFELIDYDSFLFQLNIILYETGIELEEAVVTGSSFSSEEAEGISVTSLDVYTTPGGAADIFQSLKTLPGLTHVSESAELYVRGGDPNETVTIVDQAAIYHPFTFESSYGGIFSNLNTESFRSLYFSSGGFSVKYGNALSGVLDIETVNEPSRLSGTAGISMAAAAVSGNIPFINDKFGITLSAQQSYTGPIMWLNGELDRFTSTPASRNISGSVIYRYSKTGRIKFFSMYADDSQGVEVDQPEYSGSFTGDSRNKFYNLQQSDILWSNVFISNSISFSSFGNNWNLGVLDLESIDDVFRFRSDIEVTANRRTKLNFGFEVEQREKHYLGKIPLLDYDIRPESESLILDERLMGTRIGAYMELVNSGFPGINDLFIVTGLRFDFLTDHKLDWLNPRLGIGYRLGLNSNITAAVGLFSQMPELRLLTRVDGNPSLKELSAIHYTLSYEAAFGSSSFRTELYYKDYFNLPLEDEYLNYTSEGYGYAYGLDLIIKGTLPGGLDGWFSYGFIDTKRKWMEYTKLTSSNFNITHNLSLVLKYYLTAMLQIGLNYKYATGRPYTPVVGAKFRPGINIYEPQFGAANSQRHKDYQRLDLRITYLNQLFGKYFTVLYIEALNVLDFSNLFAYTYNFDYSQKVEVNSYFGRRTIVVGGMISF